MDNPIRLIEAHQQRVDKMNGEIEIGPNGQSIDLLRAVYRSSNIPLPTRLRAASLRYLMRFRDCRLRPKSMSNHLLNCWIEGSNELKK